MIVNAYYVIFFVISFIFSIVFDSAIFVGCVSFFILAFLSIDKLKKPKVKTKKVVDFSKIKNIQDVDELTYKEFEYFVSYLFQKLNYKTIVTKQSYDYGVDVICVKNGKKICIQAKKYVNTVGIKSVQEVFAGMKYYGLDEAFVVTTAPNFSRQAKRLASKLGVKLIDRQGLENLLKQI